MNKHLKITLFVLSVFIYCSGYAGNDYKAIEITTRSGEIVSVPNYSNFSFIGTNGEKYNGKIYIFNDSQFTYYNYFNELGKDTLNIRYVEFISVRGGKQRYKIRPVLVVLGLVMVPYITVPVVVFKLVARKKVYQWIAKEDFSIKISIREE